MSGDKLLGTIASERVTRLEHEMFALVKAFEQETGLVVKGLSVEHAHGIAAPPYLIAVWAEAAIK